VKGTLTKTEQGWTIRYFDTGKAHDIMYCGESLPLHPDNVKEIEIDSMIFDNIEARIAAYPDVEFEIVDYSQKCKECGETVERGRSCTKGCFMKSGNFVQTDRVEYAKLIKTEYPELEGTINLCNDITKKRTGKMTEEEWQAAERAQTSTKVAVSSIEWLLSELEKVNKRKMKTVVIGDVHGRSVWKLIYELEKPDRMIFIGDYFDSFDISGNDQLNNFQDILKFKESGICEVVLLIGNHDHHYFPEVGDTGTSGYQHLLAPSISYIIGENKKHLQMAYQMGQFLFTHAGVSSDFMDSAFGKDVWKTETLATDLNELHRYKPKSFTFGAYCDQTRITDPYGDDIRQSPIWIRPRSLMKANRDTLRKDVIQIVGHTQVERVDKKGGATGGRYWFIDCLGTSGEYLIINDEEISFGKI
jgi:hypothetical protein